jgi:hypothetical protein
LLESGHRPRRRTAAIFQARGTSPILHLL